MSRAARHVIGVDIGTQSTKALLVDAVAGRVVAQASVPCQPDTPRPLWAEQWPEVWLRAVGQAVARVVALGRAQGVAPGDIAALCVSALYGGSGIPVDARGEPTHPCLIWMDRRAQAQVERLRAGPHAQDLQRISGNGIDSYHGFAKILWLRDERPEAWARTTAFWPPNTFVNQRLTGEVAVDHSAAGNLGGVYDLAARRWSAPMLEALGIPASMMPARLVAPSEVVGRLHAEGAARLGLPEGLPVVAGGVDAAVATLAAGVQRPGQHVAMIGTSMCWGTIRRTVDPAHGLVAMPHVAGDPRDLYVFGGAITAGASITWLVELLRGRDGGGGGGGDGGDAALHDELQAGARALPPGAQGLLFLPYLMGERSPIWDASASGAFIGLGLHHGRAHLYRAALEGVAFALRHNIDSGQRDGTPLDPGLAVVGGATRSDLWMQLIADITRRPVFTLGEEVEASLGAAMLAAMGVGLLPRDGSAPPWVPLQPRATPHPDAASRYDALYAQYLAAYPALRGVMHGLRGA